MKHSNDSKKKWPVLSYEESKASYYTLHMWTQILGKIKLETLPWMNHSWHVTLKTSPTGLTTESLPFNDFHFQIDLDLIRHKLKLSTSEGAYEDVDLPRANSSRFLHKII